MKHAAMALVSVLLFAVPALAYDCDCVAPDGSCHASVSCPQGCFAICGNQGNCSSGCQTVGPGGPQEPRQEMPSPLRSPTASPGRATANLVTFNATDLTGDDLAGLLEDALGSDVRFLPTNPLETYSLDVIEFPPDQLARAMAEFGVVAVAGSPKSGPLEGSGAQDALVTIRLEDTTMGVVVGLLDQLAGTSQSIQAVDPAAPFNLKIQSMPLDELLAAMKKMGAIQIE